MLQTKSIDGQKRRWVIWHVRRSQIWMSKGMLWWLFLQQTLFGTLRCAHEWIMSHMWISCVAHRITLMDESYHAYQRYVVHVNESCDIYQRCTSHMWMSHVTHVNESCHTCEWVMSHLWMSHVTHVNESWHMFEMCHVTHVNESLHVYRRVVAHIWVMVLSPFTAKTIGTLRCAREQVMSCTHE